MPQLADLWKQTWNRAEKAPPENLHTRLNNHYNEPQRAYHTLQHIEECLVLFEPLRHLTENAVDVELAIWFHDVIYDPKSNSNEEDSADFAAGALQQARTKPEQVERVRQLINFTKHTQPPSGTDAQLLIDIDLSILGAESERFDEYEEQIRFEYAWVPWVDYCNRRAALLRRFVERPTIFASEQFIAAREKQARENIERSIEKLAL